MGYLLDKCGVFEDVNQMGIPISYEGNMTPAQLRLEVCESEQWW